MGKGQHPLKVGLHLGPSPPHFKGAALKIGLLKGLWNGCPPQGVFLDHSRNSRGTGLGLQSTRFGAGPWGGM